MNVWTALPRLLVFSRCPHKVRSLVEESLSSRIRHYSTNTPVLTKPPDAAVTQFSDLVKKALARADSEKHNQHSAPRLPITSDALTISMTPEASEKKTKRRKKKAASKNITKSTKSKKRESRKLTAKPIPKKQELQDASEQPILSPPPSQELERSLSAIPTENWVTEPWWVKSEDRPEEIDRSYPPHILEQVIYSEGILNPSKTSSLVDVPAVEEHLPVARLCHGLERVLFKYVTFGSTFLGLTDLQPRCSLGTRPAFGGV
jgi:hypothetical protein